jgi:1,4-alpha-glucan branching enzyme
MLENRLTRLGDDPWLAPQREALAARRDRMLTAERRLTQNGMTLADFASGHEFYGLHRAGRAWVFREWAPNARELFLVGDFSGWQPRAEFACRRLNHHGDWELHIPGPTLRHGDLYRLRMRWEDGEGDRIPAWCRRVVQDPQTLIFNAQVWRPQRPYRWRHAAPPPPTSALIYEAHVGMAQDREGVGTYCEFRQNMLPRIAAAGYNTIQLMAILEHPYYGSFGYHVSNFFAASSRFGTPDELKALIDDAHGRGLTVIIDLVHSHAATNEAEGLSCFDGTPYQFFHDGPRGRHAAWDSRCFDYGKPPVVHFLLSNCRFWLDEYRVDGFRFDGVTSMLYFDHGLGPACSCYDDYFDPRKVDADAVDYLALANRLIHQVRPGAMTVAEDVSGMVGLGAPTTDGGLGFDYKLAMGIPDYWFRLLRDVPDEQWSVDEMFNALCNRRLDERTVSYVECHDQSIVGGKTLIFELADAAMYHAMAKNRDNLQVERAMALHKMIRLVTLATAGHGYLTFMGNEFGHPEWVDFPRQGNQWSYHYARRQWRLRDDPALKYHCLADFDQAMIALAGDDDFLARAIAEKLYAHCDDQVLAFRRADLLFLFNFSPARSFSDYPVDVPPGRYSHVMDSDDAHFGGQGRIVPQQDFLAGEFGGRTCIRVYLPARTAMVLRQG